MYSGYQSLTDIPKLPEVREELVDMAAQFRHHPTHEILAAIGTCQHFYGQIQLCGLILGDGSCYTNPKLSGSL